MSSNGTMAVAFASGRFYLNLVLIVGSCAMIDYFTNALSILFNGSISGLLHELVRKRNTLNSKLGLPQKIIKLLDVYNVYTQVDIKKEEVNMILKDNKKANVADLEPIDRVLINKNILDDYGTDNYLNRAQD